MYRTRILKNNHFVQLKLFSYFLKLFTNLCIICKINQLFLLSTVYILSTCLFTILRYTFSSNHNIYKSLCGLLWGFKRFSQKILVKSINWRVWSPKTKATGTFMNVVIWQKSISKDIPWRTCWILHEVY